MIDHLLTFLDGGLLQLSWPTLVLITLVSVQITIASVTIYLHRHQAHRALDLHGSVSHFFRFWLWLTTGMVTKQWVAVHRKHHAKCETEDDPHSPQVDGIRKVLWDGVDLYRVEAAKADTLDHYGHGTPSDWLERNVYTPHKFLGISLLLIIDFLLFGVIGIAIWGIQMLWIPFWAAGVINGVGHWWGYRNYETPDASRNISILGIWIGGEEMHNNHHAFPSSAKFSNKWWEFDIGWMYIRILALFGLAKVKKVAPKPRIESGKELDLDTLRAVFTNRLHVMANYAKQVMLPVLKQTPSSFNYCRRTFRQAKSLLIREQSLMDTDAQAKLDQVLERDSQLQTVYTFRLRLQGVWDRAASSHDALLQALKDWCAEAEATGIKVLQDFARSLRGYSLSTRAA